MQNEVYAIIVVGLANAAMLGLFWNMSKQGGDLRERIARIEGKIEAMEKALATLQVTLVRDRDGHHGRD